MEFAEMGRPALDGLREIARTTKSTEVGKRASEGGHADDRVEPPRGRPHVADSNEVSRPLPARDHHSVLLTDVPAYLDVRQSVGNRDRSDAGGGDRADRQSAGPRAAGS